jgi:rhodanese-related sulfurtransferase
LLTGIAILCARFSNKRDESVANIAQLKRHAVNGKEITLRNTEMASKTLFVLFLFTFMLVSKSFAAPDFEMIDTAQLHSMVVDNAYRLEGGRKLQFSVIDARTKEEYNEAHICSAISIPEKDFEEFMILLPKDKSEQLVVYCNDNKFGTSTKWASKAAAHGYTNIIIYSDRFSAWKAQHMPTAPIDGSH